MDGRGYESCFRKFLVRDTIIIKEFNMFDSIKILNNVMSVNLFSVVDTFNVHQGSYPVAFTIRFWQSDRNDRYIPNTTTTVQVEFLRADTVGPSPVNQTVIKPMAQAYTNDASIWNCSLSQADVNKIVSGGIRVTITEGPVGSQVITVVYAKMVIRKSPSSDDVSDC